jgi:hypothetical protein
MSSIVHETPTAPVEAPPVPPSPVPGSGAEDDRGQPGASPSQLQAEASDRLCRGEPSHPTQSLGVQQAPNNSFHSSSTSPRQAYDAEEPDIDNLLDDTDAESSDSSDDEEESVNEMVLTQRLREGLQKTNARARADDERFKRARADLKLCATELKQKLAEKKANYDSLVAASGQANQEQAGVQDEMARAAPRALKHTTDTTGAHCTNLTRGHEAQKRACEDIKTQTVFLSELELTEERGVHDMNSILKKNRAVAKKQKKKQAEAERVLTGLDGSIERELECSRDALAIAEFDVPALHQQMHITISEKDEAMIKQDGAEAAIKHTAAAQITRQLDTKTLQLSQLSMEISGYKEEISRKKQVFTRLLQELHDLRKHRNHFETGLNKVTNDLTQTRYDIAHQKIVLQILKHDFTLSQHDMAIRKRNGKAAIQQQVTQGSEEAVQHDALLIEERATTSTKAVGWPRALTIDELSEMESNQAEGHLSQTLRQIRDDEILLDESDMEWVMPEATPLHRRRVQSKFTF